MYKWGQKIRETEGMPKTKIETKVLRVTRALPHISPGNGKKYKCNRYQASQFAGDETGRRQNIFTS
jgi:hypothetical protein